MRFAVLPLALAALCAASSAAQAQPIEARAKNLGFTSISRGENGRVDLMTGATSLRAVDADAVSALFKGELGATYGFSADDSVRVDQVTTSADGRRFHRGRQLYRGVPVWGDGLVVQTDAQGRIEAVFGSAIAIGNLAVDNPRAASELYAEAVRTALLNQGRETRVAAAGARLFRYSRAPELSVFAAAGHAPTLAWDADIYYAGNGRPFSARVFVDARSGALLHSYTYEHHALNRAIHNLNNTCISQPSQLPGPLAISEGGSSSDAAVNRAYTNIAHVYWWFRNAFGRDSWDGAGRKLTVTVKGRIQGEQSCSGDDAFFLFEEGMIYLGNGGTYNEWTLAGDVLYHEFGHGVTQTTSGLVYEKESGGLNEAASDVYAAMVSAWMNTVSGQPNANSVVSYAPNANTWNLGEALIRNGSGAFRYMNDPKKDGQSLDHYSQYVQQYGSNCTPSDQNDQCGVHLSSGIANLAFYLLANGGTHPRGGSTVQVTAIPLERAIRYFYEGHVNIVQANDGFSRMRNAMMTRARANGTVGACDEVRIGQAWDAVGVTGTAPANANACGGSGGNQSPVASFSATPSGLAVAFNGSGSSDPDGSIASYSWSFGDGTSGSGATTNKTYGAAGSYSVSLTVTDNQGASATQTQAVTVSSGSGSNQPPVASFTATPSGLGVAFDGRASRDPDGSIASYNWNFGDGSSGSGATASKNYSAAGSYSVSLSVTDNRGATNTSTRTVTVSGGGTAQCPGSVLSGRFSGRLNETQIQPAGSGYYTATNFGLHTICLSGPAGTNFDIYLDYWNGSYWSQVAWGRGSSSSERFTYNGPAGHFSIRVVNRSGTGNYSVSVQKP